jgi:pimeloyl-ACP methyl ester carboxylesterase
MKLNRLLPPAALALALIGAALPGHAAETTRVLTRESVIARYADAQSRFIDVDGVDVPYMDEGSGPVLLLVHGTLGDLSDWDAWAAVLSRHYRVLRLDLPAFGLTGPLRSGNYSVDRWLSLVDAFMDRLGAKRFAIAGTSYGGLVAFRYAATRVDRVTGLILANSAGIQTGKGPSEVEKPSAKARKIPDASVFSSPVITADDIEANLYHLLADEALVTPDRVARKLAYANTRGRGEEAIAGRTLYERGDPQRVLAHVRAPALVLWGAANRALNIETAQAFADAMKNACRVDVRIYPEAGHMLMVDTAARSAADVQAFLASLSAAPLTCGAGRTPAG